MKRRAVSSPPSSFLIVVIRRPTSEIADHLLFEGQSAQRNVNIDLCSIVLKKENPRLESEFDWIRNSREKTEACAAFNKSTRFCRKRLFGIAVI